jgi:predicted flap endonuclease-1-like 5' DNA nuclease
MMKFFKISLLSALLLASPLEAVFAKDFPATEIAELQTVVNGFDTAMRANDTRSILKVMPPKIWGFLKEKSKFDDEKLIQVIGDALAAAMKDVTIIDFKMDVAAATTHELSDGTSYMLIPTVTKMDVKNYGKVAASSQTLALRDEGKWYLVRISDPQQKQIVTTVYPAFKDVELPSDKLEDIKE